MGTGEQSTQVELAQSIYNRLKEDIRDYRLLKAELIGLMDGIFDTICIDYSMKVVNFINAFHSLQQAEKNEDSNTRTGALLKVDESVIQTNIITMLREAEYISKLYCLVDEMCKSQRASVTGQEFQGVRLDVDVFRLASDVLSIPLGSMAVIGIDVGFLRTILNVGVQGAMDAYIQETNDYRRQYDTNALLKLRATLESYLKFVMNAVTESRGNLALRAESQRQRDVKMEQEICKIIMNIFEPFEYSDGNPLYNNDTRSELLLLKDVIEYIEACEAIYTAMNNEARVSEFGDLFDEEEHEVLPQQDLGALVARYNELKPITERVCRLYKVHTISNIQMKRVTQYRVRGAASDYVALKNVSNIADPVAFTDKLMSLGIISNKMVYVVYVVLRSIFRDSDYSFTQSALDKKDKKNPSLATLSKSVINILSNTSLVPQKIPQGAFATNMLTSEMVNVDAFKGRSDYAAMVNNQFVVQIERLLATVLAGLRKVLAIDERAKDVFSHEKYSKRRMCEDLSSLLASESNFRFINGKMMLFDLEIIPKKVRKELCGDKPELELITSADFFDLKSVYSMVKEPLVHYDRDNGILYYIPMGRPLNHYEDDEVSFSNFIYTYTREKKASEKAQKNHVINIHSLVHIEYAPDSVFNWLLGQLATIEQYTVVSNRSDRLFRVYSDELSYGKVYQRKLNKADTEELVEANTVLLSAGDMAMIRNDAMFNENIMLPGYASVDKENRLLKLRSQMSLIANDAADGERRIFLTKGTLTGNDVYVFDRDRAEQPVNYLGCMYCPEGNNPSLLRFQMATKANPVKFSLNLFGISSKPNHTGKKGRAAGINKLQNNAMYASRKVLITILSQYAEKYSRYYSSPFALTYIFQKYKKEILVDYFRNLKLIMELIQRDNLGDFFARVFSDSTLAPVVYSLLQSDAPLKGVTESVDLTINGYVIDEVINMFLLLQKNKKMQMWYEKSGSYQGANEMYDSGFLYYQPTISGRPTPTDIDNVVVDCLDFTEDNLNYDFITLEDLWGLPITSSEKTVISKSFQVFGVIKGVYKLSLDNLNPQKPAEETHKQALCNVLRALYSLYCAQEIKAPEHVEDERLDFEFMGGSEHDTTGVMKEQKQMLLSTLTSAKAGEDTINIGFEENGAQVNWFDKIDWVKYGVVGADGQVDKNWVKAYKSYIVRIVSMTPLRDVHKESTYGKKFYKSRVNPEYIGYVLAKTLLETKYEHVNGKNTLFFNRLHAPTGEAVDAPSVFVEVAQAYYRAKAHNLIPEGLGARYAGELYLAVRGIKKPTIQSIADKFQMLAARELSESFAVDLGMPDDAANAFGETILRLMSAMDVLDNQVLHRFEEFISTKLGSPVELMEYLIAYGKEDQDKWIVESLQPAAADLSDEYVINEYIHNILVEETPASGSIDLPFFGSDNYKHQTFIRDSILLNLLFKGGSTDLMKTLLTRGQAEFEKQFRMSYDRLNLNAYEQLHNLLYNSDTFKFMADDIGKEVISQFMGQFSDKILWNVAHPIEFERVMCLVLDLLFLAGANSTELIHRFLSELMADRSLNLEELRTLEERAEMVAARDAFFQTLKAYSPKSLVQVHANAKSAVLEIMGDQYRVSLPNIEDAKVSRRVNNKLYEKYLQTGNRAILEKIDMDIVDFEVLSDNAWLKEYTIVPRYSVRGMVRNNPYLFTSYATYQQVSGQAYSEGELEQDITGSNDSVSSKGATKRNLPSYVAEFGEEDAPGLVEAVTSRDILSGVDWYTSPIPELNADYFSKGGCPVAVDINPYDLMDIWYVHKLLIRERGEQYQAMLDDVCNPKNRNKGVILSWLIENGAKWKSLADQGEIDFSNSAWGMQEYRDLARVLEVQASKIIPKVMMACGLKLAYNNLYDAIKIVKGDCDGSYVAGVFNYCAMHNILQGFQLIPGKDGAWYMDAGYMGLTEGTADSPNVRAFMENYESFCGDYFMALFFLQSLTFETTDTALVTQYKDYWCNLPRQIIAKIIRQSIKVDRGLHTKVYTEATSDYRLPFKRIKVEDICS